MPRIDTDRRRMPGVDALRPRDRALNVALVALIAWGVLAFGAVYPWAYYPLIGASALVGLLAFTAGDAGPALPSALRPIVPALAAIAAVALLQTVPLPPRARTLLSPATEPFLRSIDLSYSTAAALSAQGADIPVPRRPLSLNPSATLRSIALLAGFTALLVGATRYFARRGATTTVIALVGLGVLVALIGIVQKALLGDDPWSGMKIYGFWTPQYKLTTPFGPFVNKNHFAGWMLMALPLGVGYLIALAAAARIQPSWRERLLWLSSAAGGRFQLTAFAIVLMAASLVLTRSRSGIACFVLTLLVAAYAAARAHRSTRGRLAILIAVAALIALPLVWTNVDIVTRFTSGGQSVELRRQAWRDARAIIRDFPLTGTGLNTYGTATLVYNTAKTDLHFQEAHNDYLQLAAEGGLLIGIPALIAALACVRAIRRLLNEDRDNPLRYWIRFGAATGLAAMALQSAVEFSLQMPGNAVFFVLLSAIALHASPRALDGDNRASMNADVLLSPARR